MNYKEEFIQIYQEEITREGSDKLLQYLDTRSDFFTAPAALTGAYAFEGGLCAQSLQVYESLMDYMSRERVQGIYNFETSLESIAVVSLLHLVYNTNRFHPTGDSVTPYQEKDLLPYGCGEKSVYIVNGFLRLSRDEAMAIRWQKGYASHEPQDAVTEALSQFPLAFALSLSIQETLFLAH